MHLSGNSEEFLMRLFLARATVTLLALIVVVGGLPRNASADASGLCRSFGMITLAPTDVLFGPFIAAKDLKYGMDEMGDALSMKLLMAIPGYLWLCTLQGGGAILRVISGGLEFIPGVFTLFREGPSKPMFTSQDEAWALYSADWGPCPIRVGVSYQTINEN
jgi:hypothetical protein